VLSKRPALAEPLLQEALRVRRLMLGSDVRRSTSSGLDQQTLTSGGGRQHPEVAKTLGALGNLYMSTRDVRLP
jgi:hypothetical protein